MQQQRGEKIGGGLDGRGGEGVEQPRDSSWAALRVAPLQHSRWRKARAGGVRCKSTWSRCGGSWTPPCARAITITVATLPSPLSFVLCHPTTSTLASSILHPLSSHLSPFSSCMPSCPSSPFLISHFSHLHSCPLTHSLTHSHRPGSRPNRGRRFVLEVGFICGRRGGQFRSINNMGMQRALTRLMRLQAQAWSSCSGALTQRGAAALSSQQVREYVSSTSSAAAFPLDGFSRSELSESAIGKRQPAWQEWSRGYSDSSVQKDDVQGNVEVLEFGTHKTTTAKRFAVGTTAVDVDEVTDVRTEEMRKEKAKEILQQVHEKLDETVEEAKVRQLQETLVRTEGIGEVVQDLYNKPEVDHTTEYQTGANA